MKIFRGRVAVVTGAASGIGLAMCERFAAEGMKIVMADVEEPALEAAEGRLRAAGATVIAVPTDVRRVTDLEHLADETVQKFGAVHVLCNNAGVSVRGTVWETTLADWEWIMAVNLGGVIHGIRAFVPLLIHADEAHVVNTASVAGLINGVLGAYSTTKQAVVGLSEALYFDLRRRGHNQVGVSVLCPGWVNTRISESERNRPKDAGAPAALTEQEEGIAEAARQVVAAGKDPAEVAQMVFEAIRDQRFYILTHPEMNGAIAMRFHDVLEGNSPRATFG